MELKKFLQQQDNANFIATTKTMLLRTNCRCFFPSFGTLYTLLCMSSIQNELDCEGENELTSSKSLMNSFIPTSFSICGLFAPPKDTHSRISEIV
jgi:hypothetical protein